MEKVIVEQDIGGTGDFEGSKAGIYMDEGMVKVAVAVPLTKLLGPVNKIVDAGIDKIEDLIPGEWDKALLEPARAFIKAEILKLIGS